MPEQIVETVNAIPQEWISERIVHIPVAPAEEQTVFQVTYSAPTPVIEYSVTHETPSEQFSPFPQETAEVVQVMPHERLLQRTDVLSIEHNTSAPSATHVTPCEQFSPFP